MATYACKFCSKAGLHWGHSPSATSGLSSASTARLFEPDGTMHHTENEYGRINGCIGQGAVTSKGLTVAPMVESGTVSAQAGKAEKLAEQAFQVAMELTKGFAAFGEETKGYKDAVDLSVGTIADKVSKLDEKWTGIAKSMQTVAIKINDQEPVILKGKIHPQLPHTIRILKAGDSVYLRGPAGSGKTTGTELIAEVMGLRYGLLQIGPLTTKGDIFGFNNMATGEYQSTLVRDFVENGGLLVLDEIDNGLPGFNVQFNIICEPGNRKVPFPDKIVEKHSDFHVVVTANTYGLGADAQYMGRNPQDAAFLDRFSVLNWDYDWDLVHTLANNYEWTEYVRKLHLAASKRSLKVVIGPRAAIRGAQLIRAGYSIREAADIRIWPRISVDDRKALENEVPLESKVSEPLAGEDDDWPMGDEFNFSGYMAGSFKLSFGHVRRVKKIYESLGKISAISEARSISGCYLADAKTTVESMASNYGWTNADAVGAKW